MCTFNYYYQCIVPAVIHCQGIFYDRWHLTTVTQRATDRGPKRLLEYKKYFYIQPITINRIFYSQCMKRNSVSFYCCIGSESLSAIPLHLPMTNDYCYLLILLSLIIHSNVPFIPSDSFM